LSRKNPRYSQGSPANRGRAPSDRDYAALAAFRRTLRTFLAFSEEAARAAGLTPQQHQALLAIRGAKDSETTVGELAASLLLKPHTVVGLADRLARAGLVRRKPDAGDRRRVLLAPTAKGEKVLKRLSATHLAEIRRNAGELADALRALADRPRARRS
jgi:DNA-binding MarR family transcriptional regulator